MVTLTDVKELIEGRGLEPGEEENPTVLDIVLERLMRERGVETYDDLFEMFTDAAYDEWGLETFIEECNGTSGAIDQDFMRGVASVLELDYEEMGALAWANVWGRSPAA